MSVVQQALSENIGFVAGLVVGGVLFSSGFHNTACGDVSHAGGGPNQNASGSSQFLPS